MAYTSNEFLVVIDGALPSGEVWSNTWCVLDTVGGQDRQQAVDHFHQAYAGFNDTLSNDWTALNCTTVELSTGLGTVRDWETVTGQLTDENLPTECAIRISLTDLAGHNGGPFMAGWTAASLTVNGLLSSTAQTNLTGNLEGLNDLLQGDDFTLRINRPTVESTVPALRGRVGVVFDVIRRRRSAIPENYSSVSLV